MASQCISFLSLIKEPMRLRYSSNIETAEIRCRAKATWFDCSLKSICSVIEYVEAILQLYFNRLRNIASQSPSDLTSHKRAEAIKISVLPSYRRNQCRRSCCAASFAFFLPVFHTGTPQAFNCFFLCEGLRTLESSAVLGFDEYGRG